MNPPFLIGICGGSASGKSQLASQLLGRFKNGCASLVCLDRYYRNPEAFPEANRGNYDHPDAIDQNLLKSHLMALKAGRSVELPEYDFSQRRRIGCTPFPPRPVVLVEGLLLLSIPDVRSLMETTLYVDAPGDIRLARRLRRDTLERGRTMESVLKQYEETVRPMHLQHVERYRRKADHRISGLNAPEIMVEAAIEFLTTFEEVRSCLL